MDLERISKKSVHKVLEEGAKEVESYLVRVRSLTAYIDDDKVKNLEEKLDQGISIRVLLNGKMGQSSSTFHTTRDLEECGAKAVALAADGEVVLALPGENAAGGEATFDGVVGSMCFQVFSLEVAATGLTERVARHKGFDVAVQKIEASSKVHYMPGAEPLLLKIVIERPSGRLLGGHMAGREGVARRINTLAVAVQSRMTVETLSRMDFAYAPQFSAPFDPILIAAEQALKRL